MFSKFAEFWIKNSKLTIVLIILTILTGIFSWIILPKQYNPDIIVPAFQIDVPAYGYSSYEIEELIVKPLENKINEIEGVEHIFGYANKNFGSVMVSFYVGVDKEKATTRLYNKIYSNMDLKPKGAQEPIIKPIDPDEIPIFSLSLINNSQELNNQENLIRLREIGQDIIDVIKNIEGASTTYIIGGDKNNINIKLDLHLLEANNIDISYIYNILTQNNINAPGGTISIGNSINTINIVGSLDTIEKVKKLIIYQNNNSIIYLDDVAHIYQGKSQDKSSTYFSDGHIKDAITIGIAKKKGTNTVKLVELIKTKLDDISKLLPDGIEIIEIQNEGSVAKEATNMLLINLIQSIIIVLIILTIFLGYRNAINIAISIPLTLSIIFLFAQISGDNINRITLFALILVLGMLVDDATVVVDNLNRHLNIRHKTGKTKLNAIFDAIKEVELGVILSTITRLLAFFAMFFVTGMMGEYMGPIPKYAIVAMITSTIIALSINPFLAYFFAPKPLIQKDEDEDEDKNKDKNNINFLKKYESFLLKFLGSKYIKKRKIFKIIFWLILFVTVCIPPYTYIFKGRMLPKSDQKQIYLRIDNTRNTNIDGSREIVYDLEKFFRNYYVDLSNINDESKIIKNINYRIGDPPMSDFSNLFRGAGARIGENYISIKINLTHPSERKINSENFTIQLRPLLIDYLKDKHPKVKVRLLEDPPGPPIRGTFMLEISGEPGTDYKTIIDLSNRIENKIELNLVNNEVIDIENSIEHYQTNYEIKINHEMMSRLGLTTKQISDGIYTIFNGSYVGLYHNQKTKEPLNIFLGVLDEQIGNINVLNYISFNNNIGKKIPLTEVADIMPTENDLVRYSDNRRPISYIYGEMGNNSVVYPAIDLIKNMNKKEFWEGRYEVESSGLYGFEIKDIITSQKFAINFGGERELTLDTFRDMGTAMIIAFLAIYLMMVAQFKSFKIGGVIMISFLLGFFGIFPGFTLLYIINNEYFSATSMIGMIALAGIVVGNAIILVEYIIILLNRGITLKMAIINAGYTRMKPIFITSLTTILGATTILGDPVWGGLAWSIITGLISSAILTIFILPILLYDALKDEYPESE